MYTVNKDRSAVRPPSRASPLPQGFSTSPTITFQQAQKRRPESRLSASLPELPPKPTRNTVNVSFLPRPFRTDRPAPAVIPAVIGTLAIKGIGLVIQHIHPKLRIPMAIPPRWWREARRSAWQRLGGFGRDGRLARYRRRRWRGTRLRRRERRWWCLMFRWLLDRTSA